MSTVNEAFVAALSDAGVLAPLALVLISTGCFVRYKISASRISHTFQLRSLESIELDRSMLLYKKVHDRRNELHKLAEEVDGDLLARYRRRKIIRQKYAEELEDIDAYGNHLRSTIVRLRRKPIQRLRSWLHICSAQQAFGRSLTAYAVISCLGLIELNCLQQLLLVDESEISFALFSRWEEIRAPMLYANWLAAGLMLVYRL
jgi:hypothetical protein